MPRRRLNLKQLGKFGKGLRPFQTARRQRYFVLLNFWETTILMRTISPANKSITQTLRICRIEVMEVTQRVEERHTPTLEINANDLRVQEMPATPKSFTFWPQEHVNPNQLGRIFAARRPEANARWVHQYVNKHHWR